MADPSNLPPLPKDHLDHPEQWATGQDPATAKQKGFIKVLEGQHAELVPDSGLPVDDMGKSEASEVIDRLKKGQPVSAPEQRDLAAETPETNDEGSRKRKERPSATAASTGADEAGSMEQAEADAEVDGVGKAEEGDEDGDSVMSEYTRGVKEGERRAEEERKKAKEPDDEDDTRTTKKAKVDEEHGEPKTQDTTNAKDAEANSADEPIDLTDDTPPVHSSPPDEDVSTPTVPSTNPPATALPPAAAGAAPADDTIPGDGEHLDHPENWATGDEPATEKQKAFVAVLEKQKGVSVEKGGLGKSEASEKIDELQNL